jgi:hypothetical protein
MQILLADISVDDAGEHKHLGTAAGRSHLENVPGPELVEGYLDRDPQQPDTGSSGNTGWQARGVPQNLVDEVQARVPE